MEMVEDIPENALPVTPYSDRHREARRQDARTNGGVHRAWYVLAILCIVTLFSQLDRQLTAIIVRPLKQEFGLSDTQFSLLHGYAFAVTYAIFGLPFGRLVDRANRRNIVFYGLVAWSALTMLAAFAVTFTQLVMLRTGVGIGEAVLAPAAYSLIIDYFEPSKRGRAFGIYYIAMAVGGGGSLILGGVVLGLVPPPGINLGGSLFLSPWRFLFLAIGLPGMLVSLLVLTTREPKRDISHSSERVLMGQFFRYIWSHRSLLGRISVISILTSTIGYAVLAWSPTLLERRFGMPPAQAGFMIGVTAIGGSILGPMLGGWLSDRGRARGATNPRLRVMLWGSLALVPASFWSIMPDPSLSILVYGLMSFGVGVVQSAMPLALQEAVPGTMRGQIIALQLLILGFTSQGFGPTTVALLTDQLFRSDDMLPWSLVTLSLPVALLGAWFCWGGRHSDIPPASGDRGSSS